MTPGSELHVNQHREHGERQRVQENTFSIHLKGRTRTAGTAPSTALTQVKAPKATAIKVNDAAVRVNASCSAGRAGFLGCDGSREWSGGMLGGESARAGRFVTAACGEGFLPRLSFAAAAAALRCGDLLAIVVANDSRHVGAGLIVRRHAAILLHSHAVPHCRRPMP